MIRTRFAPSPTGPLHLGHAFSAITAHDYAKRHGGTFFIRIEDLDHSRARPHWEDQIYEDLAWLGLDWETPVLRQSDRTEAYEQAVAQLQSAGLLYPCTCTRRDISDAATAPHTGPDGLIYPGTCRTHRGHSTGPNALRLNMAQALAYIAGRDLTYPEIGPDRGAPQWHSFTPNQAKTGIGDVVLTRKDQVAAYHLAVVVDDAYQGITHVVRGDDLKPATDIHVILQHCLSLPTPQYYHHRLVCDDAGKRLAKRDDARALSTYRAAGHSPGDIRAMLGLGSPVA